MTDRELFEECNRIREQLLAERDALAAQLATTTRDLEEIGQMCTQYAESDAKWADALAAVNHQLAEAVGIAWQLREACGTVLRDAYNEDWPEVSAAAAAFDALHWPDHD